MADKAHEWTDEQIKELEEEIKNAYKQAYSDIAEKWDKYMSHMQTAVESEYKAYRDALDSGNRRDIRNARRAYEEAVKDETIRSQRYRAMLEQTVERISKANSIALNYINGDVADVYVRNRVDSYNDTLGYVTDRPERHSLKSNFTQIDENTVRNLIMNKKIRLPYKELDEKKDKRWNEKKVNSQLLQGILQGESTMTVAKRLRNVTNMNVASSIRNARTMMTCAQNEGRLDSYIQLKEEGLIIKKEWMATDDEHTRESHRNLDGEIQEIEETFSNELMFPADPDGDPAEVYNCRCTMVSVVEGVKNLDGSVTMFGEEPEVEKEPETIEDYQKLVAENGLKDEYIYGAGRQLAKEYDDERYKAYNKWADEKKRINEMRDELYKKYEDLYATDDSKKASQLYKEVKKLERDFNKALSKWQDSEPTTAESLKNALSKYRKMGSEGLDVRAHLNNSRSPIRKFVEWAYNMYPTDWVKSSMYYSNLTVGKTDRGYYSHWRNELKISHYSDDHARATAVHELGHRFERVVKGIRDSEKRFYDKRTQGEELEWLGDGYDLTERARKDDFVNKYMGKDYGGSAYELVSMGFEYAYTNPERLKDDEDMYYWTLGLLALA